MRCNQCPRQCNVERNASDVGFCGVPYTFLVARAARHLWEEPPISGKNGSGTVFFAGCNLRCVFCQNFEVSHHALGKPMRTEELTDCILRLQDEGAHNINFVTPSHYTLQLARLLETLKPRLRVPVVWNSSAYESPETLRHLEGLVDIYLPDCKYYSATLSEAYSQAPDYFSVALLAIREMLRQSGNPVFDPQTGMLQSGTVVRHLVLPGCRKDSIALLQALSEALDVSHFLLSLMNQYTPDFAMHCPHPNLHRRLTSFEYQSVLATAQQLGFTGFSQDASAASAAFTPTFSGE